VVQPLAYIVAELSSSLALTVQLKYLLLYAHLILPVVLLQFTNVQPVMAGLLSKLEQVNSTVIALTASMEAAHGKLATANDNMVGVQQPALSCHSLPVHQCIVFYPSAL
jgi:uncharacterized membrane protein YjfL (UPF0719 family)